MSKYRPHKKEKPNYPTRRIKRKSYKSKNVRTEVHEAFMTLGRKNRTGKLSDSEFNRQLHQEVGYLFSKSKNHFSKAGRHLANAFNHGISLIKSIF